jgi:UDP-glucose 4-epimerase
MTASQGRFDFIEGSVCDRETVRRALTGVTHVIHLASVPSVPRSLEDPLESAHASIIGTVMLLDEARKAGVTRVAPAASSSASGDSDILPREEGARPSPMSPYAVAKLAQEYYLAAFCKCYGLDGVSLRYFNVFGPRQNPHSQYAAVIPKFITMMQAGERPVIYGDGGQTRDFTYIDNVVDANVGASLAKGLLGGATVNIGAGGAYSLNDLAYRLNTLLGTSLEPLHKEARAGDVRDSKADITRANALFGYAPAVDFAEGLRRTVVYFTGENR